MQEIHPGFETQGRHHPKSKAGVSVASRKGLTSSKNFKTNLDQKRVCVSGIMGRHLLTMWKFSRLLIFFFVIEPKPDISGKAYLGSITVNGSFLS